MKILVTGGAGFMGSDFIHYLLEKYPHDEIVNLDKLTYAGNLENLADIAKDKRYKFIKGDIADPKIVDKAMKGVDYCVNFAAETHVDRSILDPQAFIKTDVLGVHILLEAIIKYKVKRFLQISTDEVYGSIDKGLFTEQSPMSPNSPYSASKAAGEMLAKSYFVTFKTPVLITRSCNNYGPRQYPEKVIPLFITNLLENKKVPLYGDGKNVRTWIYVRDHSRAVDLVLRKGKLGEVYNIGTGEETTNLKLTHEILRLVGKNKSMIQRVADRPGHDRRYALDWTKIKKLGFKPEFEFHNGMIMTTDWYRQNTAWWQKIKSGEYAKYYHQQYQKIIKKSKIKSQN